MCKQIYFTNKRRKESKSCPYTKLYERWQASQSQISITTQTIELPHDSEGRCIFHSEDIAWKKKHNFSDRFKDLISLLLTGDKKMKELDFRAFVFTGGSSTSSKVFEINNLSIIGPVKMDDAQFKEAIVFRNIDFKGGISAVDANFQGVMRFEDCTISGCNFENVTFNHPVYLQNVIFSSYTTFESSHFLNVLEVKKTEFKHVTYFDNCLFKVKDTYGSKILFKDSSFDYTTIFEKSRFECGVRFENTSFNGKVDFLNTQFNLSQITNAAESAVTFTNFKLNDNGVLNFTSTDPLNKLFKGDLTIQYEEEDLKGLIRFENANFHYLSETSKKALLTSEKLGKVEIGKGCIKYRFQSDKKTIAIAPENQRFIIEITQVFANYFTNHHGLNLGIEIIERSDESITYFFFSDENITQEEFNIRMQESEYDLWELLFMDKDNFLETGQELVRVEELDQATFINTIDSIASLMSILFRLKNRADFGLWSKENTEAIIKSINQNQPVIFQIENFHNSLVENFDQKAFIDLSSSLTQTIKTQNNLIGKNSTLVKKIKNKRDKDKNN